MASRLEGRLARLEREAPPADAGPHPDGPRNAWKWLAEVMGIEAPEPAPGMTMGQWLHEIPDEALWALNAIHDIIDQLEAEMEAMEAEGATDEATAAYFVAAVRRRIDERYRPHPMTLRWKAAQNEAP